MIHGLILAAATACSAVGERGKPACRIDSSARVAVAPSPKPSPYQPRSCALLVEAGPAPSGLASAYYGALMAESLHAHGFDRLWPHVPAGAMAEALADWSGCFAADQQKK